MSASYDNKDQAGQWFSPPSYANQQQSLNAPQQWGPPPPQWSPSFQQQWGPPPQQSYQIPQSVIYRFSGDKKTVLNSQVIDQSGLVVYRISSDNKITQIYDRNNQVVAVVEWHHSGPVMRYHGREFKVMDWIPVTKEKNGRHLSHNEHQYTWVEENKICVLQSSPGHNVAIWNDAKEYVEVEVLPEGLQRGLVEPAILSVAMMQSGRPIGDVNQSGFLSWLPYVGGAIGAALS